MLTGSSGETEPIGYTYKGGKLREVADLSMAGDKSQEGTSGLEAMRCWYHGSIQV